jgi:Pentapeptide repeats (9 copies)
MAIRLFGPAEGGVKMKQESEDELIAFLCLKDPDKDANRFWQILTDQYQDPTDSAWRAAWAGFFFPGSVDFAESTFREGSDFTGTEFANQASFRNATFDDEVVLSDASFAGEADFRGATFVADAVFNNTRFGGRALFGGATFRRRARFGSAVFAKETRFRKVTFGGNASFGRATFAGDAVFEVSRFLGHANFGNAAFSTLAAFGWSTFEADAKFGRARFGLDADFHRVTFHGPADFSGAEVLRCLFSQAVIESELVLDFTVLDGGVVEFRDVVNRAKAKAGAPGTGPLLRFGPMSLAKIELHSMDPSQIRLNEATDIERLSLYGVTWPRFGDGYRIADENDMRDGVGENPPAPEETERLYRGLRKNLEDRGDRVGAHGWYFAEMEVGRRYSDSTFTKNARRFYWLTSGYGLSASRAFLAFLLAAILTFVLFMIPWSGICPLVQSAGSAAGECAGWDATLRLVTLAVSFQGVPDGTTLEGLASNAVWLFARFAGAAMLVSVGVAFRNQVAR